MPSGHSGGSSGGHFGGGSFSHSGGYFGSSHSTVRSGGHFAGSGSFSSTRPIMHRPWYRPRVVVFGGRQVYLGTGRASAASVLGVLIVIALLVTAFLGFSWSDNESKLSAIRADYEKYHAMAEYAYAHPEYQHEAVVDDYEPYDMFGKYCIFYHFTSQDGHKVEGYSFYVYSFHEAAELKFNGVSLALDVPYSNSTAATDSVPLDYRDASLDDDDEYLDILESRDTTRVATFVLIGMSVLLILSSVLVRATASKATAEQIAADKQATTSTTNNQSTPTGTWRCDYCNTLNDNSKERCDACGATRQK